MTLCLVVQMSLVEIVILSSLFRVIIRFFMRSFIKSAIILVFILSTWVIDVAAQDSSAPFMPGESLTYVMSYKWGSVNTDVGEAVTNLSYSNGMYHSIIKGYTYRVYDMFFKVREHFESKFTDLPIRPSYFYRDSQEGKYRMRNTFTFSRDTSKSIGAIIQKYERTPKDTILTGTGETYDLVSLFYKVRSIDFDTVSVNIEQPISFAIDEEVYNFYYVYVGKQVKKIKGVGTFNTLLFRVKLVAGSVFTGEQEMLVWITDDKNKVPLLFESPIIVGTVYGKISKYKNLKYPLTSKIK